MENLNQDETGDELQIDELATLKQRANLMGVTYHPAIGLEKLREKVFAKINSTENEKEDMPDEVEEIKPAKATRAAVVETEMQKRLRLKKEALALVRIRITCMNPAKKEWDGEIFTVGNSLIGSVSKFVPFSADEGYHVPKIIFNALRDRMCQVFVESKDAKGNKVRKGKLIREFNLEVLDQLTKDELDELAARQAARRAID